MFGKCEDSLEVYRVIIILRSSKKFINFYNKSCLINN